MTILGNKNGMDGANGSGDGERLSAPLRTLGGREKKASPLLAILLFWQRPAAVITMFPPAA